MCFHHHINVVLEKNNYGLSDKLLELFQQKITLSVVTDDFLLGKRRFIFQGNRLDDHLVQLFARNDKKSSKIGPTHHCMKLCGRNDYFQCETIKKIGFILNIFSLIQFASFLKNETHGNLFTLRPINMVIIAVNIFV